MKVVSAILVWLLLLVLLGVEFAFAYVPGLGGAMPLVGLAMAVIVAMTFMRLSRSGGLVPVFALAGVFWLCVMLGLGNLDYISRHDILVGGRSLGSPGPGESGPMNGDAAR